MSWDVFIMRFPPEVNDVREIPDGWAPPSLGTGWEIRRVLADLLPGATFTADGWCDYDGPRFSLSAPMATSGRARPSAKKTPPS